MSKSRCIFCMEETQGQYAICPRCKKGIWEYQWKETYLEPYTTLGERYFVGVILEETEESMRYVGYDLVLEQKVMIYVYPLKVWQDKKEQEASFLFGKFAVPGLTVVKDYFADGEKGYMITSFPAGITLEEYEKSQGRIPEEEAKKMMLPVVYAVNTLHAEGRIHGNISPRHLVMTEDKVLCLLIDGRMHIPREEMDSYAALEQGEERGILGPWTDIYALCATWYEMVTGQKVVTAYERSRKDRLKPPSRYTEIPQSIEKALLQGLTLDIQGRLFCFGNLLEIMGDEKEEVKRYEGAIRQIWSEAWLEAAQRTETGRRKRRVNGYLVKRWLAAGAVILCAAGVITGGVHGYIKTHQPEYFAWKLRQAEKTTDISPYRGILFQGDSEYEKVKAFVLKYGKTDGEGEIFYKIPAKDWKYCPVKQSAQSSFYLDYKTAKNVVQYYMVGEGKMDLSEETDHFNAYIEEKDDGVIALFAGKEDLYKIRGNQEEVGFTYDILDGRLLKISYTGTKKCCAYFMEKLLPFLVTETYLTKEECMELMETSLQEGEFMSLQLDAKYEITIKRNEDFSSQDSQLYTVAIEPVQSNWREFYNIYLEQPAQDNTSYAGNYERGSRRYKEFISYVKEHAVSEENIEENTDGESRYRQVKDGVKYTLKEEDVLNWGEPCNAFRFFIQAEDLVSGLKKQGYQMKKNSEIRRNTVEIEKYGGVRTLFKIAEYYQMTEDLNLVVVKDLVDGQVLQLFLYHDEDRKAELAAAVADVGKLLGISEKEDIKGLLEWTAEVQQEGRDQDTTELSVERNILFFTGKVEDIGVGIQIVPAELFDGRDYYWP